MSGEVDVAAWASGLDGLFGLVAGRFFLSEPRRRARAYVRGLLAPLAGKNGWTLAEVAGDSTPDGMQRLLNAANWDADGVRDEVRGYVVEHLGDRPQRPGVGVAFQPAPPDAPQPDPRYSPPSAANLRALDLRRGVTAPPPAGHDPRTAVASPRLRRWDRTPDVDAN